MARPGSGLALPLGMTNGKICLASVLLCLAGCSVEDDVDLAGPDGGLEETEATAVPTRPAALCGTWVLQQIDSAAQLTNQRPSMRAALDRHAVRGLSLRYPWKAIDGSTVLVESGRQVASLNGHAYAVRFMAGRHTPARVFDTGAYYYRSASGERIPKPFSDSGVAGNPVFERAWEAQVKLLAAYSRQHGMRVLHVPWYGKLWAEIDNGDEVRAARGYSFEAWLEGHRRLINIANRYAGPDLAIEFAMSGHWGPNTGAGGQLQDRMVELAGQWSPRWLVQGNGLGRYNGNPASRPIHRAMQMYDGNDYDWTAMYDHLASIDATYLEIYTPSFADGLPHAAALDREVRDFAAACPR